MLLDCMEINVTNELQPYSMQYAASSGMKLTRVIKVLEGSGGINMGVKKFYNINLTAVSKFGPNYACNNFFFIGH